MEKWHYVLKSIIVAWMRIASEVRDLPEEQLEWVFRKWKHRIWAFVVRAMSWL